MPIRNGRHRCSIMVYEFTINGRHVKSGDVLSTSDGTNSIYSVGYMALGKLIPGDVDHSDSLCGS